MAIVKGFTPNQRGPKLGDAAGGTSERPAAQEVDPVLRNPGWVTKDIRLTPTGTDVTTSVGALYDFGKVDSLAIGQYMLTWQGAATATAVGLGTVGHMEFFVKEETAAVFQAVHRMDKEGGSADADADDPSYDVAATLQALADAALDGAGCDSKATVFVATATDVINAAAWTTAVTLVAGHLYLLDALAAATHVFSVQRRAA